MSWVQQLYQTYEHLSASDYGLTPIAHMYAKAQLTVTIDKDSCFVNAEIIPKEEERTLIPVTEASSGRSSGSAPHALNDTLAYIAGDYFRYERISDNTNKKTKMSVAQKKHIDYMNALEAWCLSKKSNLKAQMILEYLKKNQLIEDLIKSDIVHIKDEKFIEEKIQGQEYAKALVRFRVFDGSDEDRTWEDKQLIHDYTDYYIESQKGIPDICYITGEKQIVSENHPKNIVSVYGNAKLISANDKSGFTFRGRFNTAPQAATVSYEASQKIHGALKWLVENQGHIVGKKDRRVFICWNPNGRNVDTVFGLFSNGFDDEDDYVNDQKIYKKKLQNMLSGCQEEFEKDDYIIISGLDAATTGRLAITYYQELLASDYWENIGYWGKTMNWYYLKFSKDKKPKWIIETPPLWKIVQYSFGNERDKFFEVDDKVMREHSQRLIKCMVEKQRLPKDIIISIVKKASMPLAYKWENGYSYNWESILSTACALILKDKIDRGEIEEDDEYNMKLDTNNRDRSYLFGRMLAVFEVLEKSAMDKDETRETNAIRLQAAFVNHPAQTWKILEDATRPYLAKLRPGSREFYKKLLSDIVSTFDESDISRMNLGLTENYLIGYYLQRRELNNNRPQKEEKENE